MIKVKPNTVILIGLITLFLLGCLFSACTKTEERQPKAAEPNAVNQPEFEQHKVEFPRPIIRGDGPDMKWEVNIPEAEGLGAVIQGNYRDIAGYVYLSDILYNDGNFWAQGAPAYLEQWMNERTKVNVRFMPQETLTKSVYLSPPVDVPLEGVDTEGVFKQPILLLSGGDRPIHLTPAEQENLRKYLVEAGGFLFIDDNAPVEGEFYRSVRRMLETVLPNQPIEQIPDDHEIYRCFYEMGEPPIGALNPTWNNRTIEGISINGRLAVIMSQEGYWEVFAGRGHYTPGALRFGVNIMIYAVTRGQIADRSAYTPMERAVER